MPEYQVSEEIEHQGIRYYPGDVVTFSDRHAEFHGLTHSLVSPPKNANTLKKIGNVGLALTRSEEVSDVT
jgi:hypothetical protein